jgi:RNA polymerase sigma factor (sigma-70 family)
MSSPLRIPCPAQPAACSQRDSLDHRPVETLGVLPSVVSALLAAREPEAQERAWAEFLETYSGLLLETAYYLGRSYDGAMDRYAFIVERLRRDDFRRLRQFQATGASRFSTWLAVVARRLCLDRARQQYGRRRAPQAEAVESARAVRRRLVDLVAERIDVTCLADESQVAADAALATAERRRTLARVAQGVDARSTLLLKLRFERDLPAREIAHLMGFPSQFHVYRELKSLLDRIRRALLDAGVDSPSL